MRITKQSSGGRGEYELSEFAPSGLGPQNMLERTIHLRLGDLAFNTEVRVTNAQGKYRLRRNQSSVMQVHRQVACALLMPLPVRDESKVTGGEPVLQNSSYIIKNIHFGEVRTDPDADFFEADVTFVDGANMTVEAKQVTVLQRVQGILTIWERKTEFSSSIAHLLSIHEGYLRAGTPVPRAAESLLLDLQAQVEEYGNPLGALYTRTTDVVPALLTILNEAPFEGTPLPIDQIEPDRVEIRRREIARWQQLVKRRGAASERFRREVQNAYSYRCLMCGGRFPPTPVNLNPGIDAAHILPWAEYDLDRVFNGVALCKLHHWAFDERLLRLEFRDDAYHVTLSADAQRALRRVDFSLDILEQVVGGVPVARLPARASDWPRPELLERFYSASA